MSKTPIRIGFIPLADCAPLVVAQELGFFDRHEIEVELRKANGWDQIVERLAKGELEAAHMLLTLPLHHALSPAGRQDPFVYAACLCQHGNGITLSNALWRAGARDAASLPSAYLQVAPDRPLRLAVVHPRSTHEYLLRLWLERTGLRVGKEVELHYAPPPEMVLRLRSGEIDGFCVGEPWNQRAVSSKLGYLITVSTDLLPNMNEKILAVRSSWHHENSQSHAGLIRAVVDACEWLIDPAHRELAVDWVASKRYVNSSREPIRAAFMGEIQAGGGRLWHPEGFLRFGGCGAQMPESNHARFYLERMWREGHLSPDDVNRLDLKELCLSDFFESAVQAMPGGVTSRLPKHVGEPYVDFLQRFPV